MKCNKCQYGWKSRKDDPISCPRCKRRFDYRKLEDISTKELIEIGERLAQKKGGRE